MKFGLEEKVIRDVITMLSSFPEIEEVILYGSRAKGNYEPGSDIDIVLKGNDLELNTVNKISLKLDDLDLPYTFDLSIFGRIDNTELLEHIRRVGISLYKRPDSK